MTAYNRQASKNKIPSSAENAMNESGYASFQLSHSSLHNSTVEAPFCTERDSESENCRNVANLSQQQQQHYHKSLTSSLLQTPGNNNTAASASSNNNSNAHSTTTTTTWRKSLSLPAATNFSSSDENSDDQRNKSPLANSLRVASKRRKDHHMHHYDKGAKKSKKKLFAQLTKPQHRKYYDGIEKLDIIGMLIYKRPALECILRRLESDDLETMTKVSKRWHQAVHENPEALERLLSHRHKMNRTKENPHVIKSGRRMRQLNRTNSMPFQPFNSIANTMNGPTTNSLSNSHNNSSDYVQSMDVDGPAAAGGGGERIIVEQAQRIKCPRCGKCSQVFSSQIRQQANENRPTAMAAALSRTMPIITSTTTTSSNNSSLVGDHSMTTTMMPFTRFYSLDEIRGSPDELERDSNGTTTNIQRSPYSFAECLGATCKFQFCIHCYSKPHPGEKCLVTELGTPSKFLIPSENDSPPRGGCGGAGGSYTKKNPKLSRQKSLKRLCF